MNCQPVNNCKYKTSFRLSSLPTSSPDLAVTLSPSAEDDVLLGAKDGNGVLLLEDFADIVAEEADAHKVVGTVGTGLGN